MMVKYDTSTLGTPGTKTGGSGGIIVGLLLAAGLAWAGYEFWWKPKKLKEQLAAKKA